MTPRARLISVGAGREGGAETRTRARLALALGGGGARGLAHVGVLDVLEREGIRVDFLAGSSMGGLIGALSAAGLDAREIADLAKDFRFPRWFIPGGLVSWSSIFGAAANALPATFAELKTPLAVTAVDLEAGTQVVIHAGALRPAVEATCAVPGVLPPVKVGTRWLVDGALLNLIPVDVAAIADPDVVVAVKVGAARDRRMPQLNWRVTPWFSRLGGFVPNPATAKIALELLARAAEIVLDHQTALAEAMIGPELLIAPELGDIGLRDFHRVSEAVAAGRRATEAALPTIEKLMKSPPAHRAQADRALSLHFDPVCGMVINPERARAQSVHEEATFYFCSLNCRDRFEHDPAACAGRPALHFAET